MGKAPTAAAKPATGKRVRPGKAPETAPKIAATVPAGDDTVVIEDLLRQQGAAMQALFAPVLPTGQGTPPDPSDLQHWGMSAAKLQKMWLDFGAEQTGRIEPMMARMADPAHWTSLIGQTLGQTPMSGRGNPFAPLPLARAQKQLWDDGLALWGQVMGSAATDGPQAGTADDLPRQDRRFADPKWREQPVFTLIHQTYLLLSEQLAAITEEPVAQDLVGGIGSAAKEQREQVRFLTRVVTEALSPANYPLTNPLVIERTLATRGENLVRGTEHFLADLRRGQLSHTRRDAFEVGVNIAATPGKVVHETPLFQLIQYAPVTPAVNAVPLLISPPWINRFYILDLNPGNSFIRWAVAQGLTVFVMSWRSADATMANLTWDDYALAQIGAIDAVRARLAVPAVHVIGYCVAGTTLAAVLAVLARRNQADKVASATFFTAQVDFEQAGDLKNFVDEGQLRAIEGLTVDGVLDGRYMAAAFNLLRSSDLVWHYVINNYLMGKDYSEFDLLYWNGDTTNLPWRWLRAYLVDLYRDNRLVVADAMRIDGTPVDLRRITTPCYIQAGRQDHIAPAQSVWKLTRQVAGPWKFVLAGSGHIAGVVNPPAAGKYQFWTNPGNPLNLDEFIAGATETKGSWWPDWLAWINRHGAAQVPATGRRAPGGRGDKTIENAPGRYVKQP